MRQVLLFLANQIVIFGKFCKNVIAEIVPGFLEKLSPTFSVSSCPDLPSTIQTMFSRDTTTSLHLSIFIFVKNYTDRALYLTGAELRKPLKWRFAEHVTLSRQYIPAGESYRILVSVYLSKTTAYLAMRENISATLCLKVNGTRKKCVKVHLKNTTNQNSNLEQPVKKIYIKLKKEPKTIKKR